jgi:hypothetical protein
LNPQEVREWWDGQDPALKEAIKATVRPQEEWENLPRQVQEVYPPDADTAQVLRILASRKLINSSSALGIWCRAGHTLASVLNVGNELVYVATVDRPVLGWVLHDRHGLHIHDQAPASFIKGRGLHIEFLSRTTADLPPALLGQYLFPARCKCEGRRGTAQIPATWIAVQMNSKHKGVTWPEQRNHPGHSH